jgi:glycosyltransferase involved in cell wall biosynthesis
MRIIYIHQYFLTPEEGGATRSYYLAKGMVDAGIEVEMITSHNKNYYDLKIIAGIKVHYLPVAYDQHFGFFKRVLAFGNFVRQTKVWLKKLPRPDLFYITSTPLTTGLIGIWAKKRFGIPFIFEVRDLWPEAPIQVGAIKNPILKNILYQQEARIYRHALKIVALSPGIASSIVKKCPQAPTFIIPNFADVEYLKLPEKQPKLLQQYNLKDELTVIYAGAIGKVNAVDELLILADLARQQDKPYQFVLLGKGAKKDYILSKAAKMKLENFHYFPFGNKQQVRELLSVADISLVSFIQLPVLATNSPNKFFDALAAGKAVLVNHTGWIADLVEKHNIGAVYNSEHPLSALETLNKLATSPSDLQKMKANAYQLGKEHFSKEMAVQKLLRVLDPAKDGKNFNDEVYILTA